MSATEDLPSREKGPLSFRDEFQRLDEVLSAFSKPRDGHHQSVNAEQRQNSDAGGEADRQLENDTFKVVAPGNISEAYEVTIQKTHRTLSETSLTDNLRNQESKIDGVDQKLPWAKCAVDSSVSRFRKREPGHERNRMVNRHDHEEWDPNVLRVRNIDRS